MKKPHFSDTRRAGSLVFVSGTMSVNKDLELVGSTIAEQTRCCLKNIELALDTEGLALQDLVKVNVWITDTADFAEFNRAYAEFFPDLPPCRTTVTSGLVLPGALIEMDAQAWDSATQ